ncbi:helix-turn-helix domain-containing protein [Streptomyces sp. NPDC059717]|uniref:helix-turn-helix domain-containing protein n=2 Tax=unclassified Streptomyces TaxID=2593676 RepID=UPI0036C73319
MPPLLGGRDRRGDGGGADAAEARARGAVTGDLTAPTPRPRPRAAGGSSHGAKPLAETVMRLRLDAGQRRLTAQPHLPVAAIAHVCGFTSPSHFARRFREDFGCTPVQWRQRSCAHP